MMNADHPAVVLVSGGMDSCVTAAIAARAHASLAFLHANYGQRTEAREAVVHASEAMHRALHELSHGVAGNPFASIVPRASQILQEGIERLAL